MCRTVVLGAGMDLAAMLAAVKRVASEKGLAIRSLAYNGRSLHAYLASSDGGCAVIVSGVRGGRLEAVVCGCGGGSRWA